MPDLHEKIQESNFPWLEERTILLTVTGSHAYGTATEKSDKDYKGVCIPPIEYYLGLKFFNEYNKSGGKNWKNTKDDVDVTILHVNKFVNDAMSGVPNNIEILFVRPKDLLKVTSLGQKLIDNRHLFLSKQVKQKFGGYAYSQIQKLKASRFSSSGRTELIELYGYDTKMFMHSVRLLSSAVEILETGDYQTYRPNREFLLDCRNGKYSFEEALEILEYYERELEVAYEKSPLPEKPDYDKVNRLLIEINREGLMY